MKRMILAASLAAMAACSQSEPAPEPTETAAAPMPGAEWVGTYTEAGPDGTTTTSVINADGTYTDTNGADVDESGMWSMDGANICFDPAGDNPDQPTRCYVVTTPDENGKFTATLVGGDGTALEISKVPDAAPADTASDDVD